MPAETTICKKIRKRIQAHKYVELNKLLSPLHRFLDLLLVTKHIIHILWMFFEADAHVGGPCYTPLMLRKCIC